MMSVEVVARTVEEAVEEALVKLDAERDQVEITVLEEGTKGLFGILGSKQAKVLVTKRPIHELKLESAEAFVEQLLAKMDIPAVVEGRSDEEAINLEISGEDLGILIGRRGQTLDAFQYLVGLAVNRQGGEWIRVIIDVEGYRQRREETLRALARRLAGKAEATGRRVALDPMNALERRIIHQELQTYEGVETHSEGREPYRRVIIVPER